MNTHSNTDLNTLFNLQKANAIAVSKSDYKLRIKKLKALQYAIQNTYRKKIKEALYADFKKPYAETDLTEIYPIVGEIKFVVKQLKSWLAKQTVKTPSSLFGASSWYIYEPKGVCLIVSPWNYPINLTFGPLISAIAAGNTVILKPSELTPHTAQVMQTIVESVFSEREIAMVQGGVMVAQALLKLPFNHIFFTGSAQVGKLVMAAAAKHLCSVTLELGGKSPTVVDETVNMEATAKKIVWGKFLNSGQTCIAPDYVLIKASVEKQFIEAVSKQITKFYSSSIQTSNSYCRIVNTKHFKRLKSHIEDAKTKGASIVLGGDTDAKNCYVSPTLITNLPDEASVLHDEIFGPILPVKTYASIEDAVTYINSKDKPLALYIYSENSTTINTIISSTSAGTTCINNNVVQYSNHYLPFGGVNTSGIGKSHGFFGFQEFSNMRSVMKQHTKPTVEMVFPPYTNSKKKLIELMLRWF